MKMGGMDNPKAEPQKSREDKEELEKHVRVKYSTLCQIQQNEFHT